MLPREGTDDYSNDLAGGSTGDIARAAGLEQLGFWKKWMRIRRTTLSGKGRRWTKSWRRRR